MKPNNSDKKATQIVHFYKEIQVRILFKTKTQNTGETNGAIPD